MDASSRRSKYIPEVVDVLLSEIRKGKSTEQALRTVGVSIPTLRRWRKRYPEFAQRFEQALEIAEKAVIDNLDNLLDDSRSPTRFSYSENLERKLREAAEEFLRQCEAKLSPEDFEKILKVMADVGSEKKGP